MIQQLRKSFLTWYGCAEVPMSKSFGRRPSSRSRTLPPTRYATWSACRSRYSTFNASGSISRRDTTCASRGTIRGSTIGGHCTPCYHRGMTPQRLLAPLFLAVAVRASAADDPLAKARQLYNQRDFLGAVSVADQARMVPGRSDDADLVAARAYLERYRDSGASDDLTNA